MTIICFVTSDFLITSNLAFFLIFRFALIYQLTKPVVKKTATESAIAADGTKVTSNEEKHSKDSSGTG